MDIDRAITLLMGQIEINQEWLKGIVSDEERKPFEDLIAALNLGVYALKEKGDKHENNGYID